eukprot:SAG31_NODE_9129_length_1329_cov_1.491057_2_plen_57_part_00
MMTSLEFSQCGYSKIACSTDTFLEEASSISISSMKRNLQDASQAIVLKTVTVPPSM